MKETGLVTKSFRTNHWGEFSSLKFTNFYSEHGIWRQLIATYTSQQNGWHSEKSNNDEYRLKHAKKIYKTLLSKAIN